MESAVRPVSESTEESKVYNYVRKNITEKEVEDEKGDKYTVFEYLEAKVAKSMWPVYKQLEQQQADIDYLTMITE